MFTELSTQGVLIGKRKLCTQEKDDTVQSHFRSIFLPKHGHNGTVYRLSEFILANSPAFEFSVVVRIVNIFATRQDANYSISIKCELYPYVQSDNQSVLHPYSAVA